MYSPNKLKIRTIEDLSETLDSLNKTQNLLFKRIVDLETKIDQILGLVEKQPVNLKPDLDSLTKQLNNLCLGKPDLKTPVVNKFVLAKPRK